MSDRPVDGKRGRNDALAALVDLLIPGDGGRWPCASDAGVDADAVADALGPADSGLFRTLADRCRDLAPDAAVAIIAAAETADRSSFGAILKALYAAYYTTAAAQRAVTALAAGSPREPEPHFDRSLVAQVVARGAGQRRL